LWKIKSLVNKIEITVFYHFNINKLYPWFNNKLASIICQASISKNTFERFKVNKAGKSTGYSLFI
jgi:hypothetical protein